MRSTPQKFTAPAGKYFLGDPCYVFSHEAWGKILDDSKFFEEPYTVPRKGTAIVFNTAYGDGEYRDGNGNKFPVDAGMIGLVPVRMADNKKPGKGTLTVEFKEPVQCYAENGTLYFGPYRIPTGDEEETNDDFS